MSHLLTTTRGTASHHAVYDGYASRGGGGGGGATASGGDGEGGALVGALRVNTL